MSTISRRTFVHAAAASLGPFAILTRRAKGAEFSYKFGTNQPLHHPLHVRASEMLPQILEETGRRLASRLCPTKQVRCERDMLRALRRGALERFWPSGINVLTTRNKVTSLYGAAFAFPNYDVM